MKKTLFYIVLGAILITSCAKKAGQNTEHVLNTRLSSHPLTLDPSTASDRSGNEVLRNLMEPLIRFDETDDGTPVIVGGGAKSWTVSEDHRIYTFILNDNYWSDGKPVTAQDYAYGITRSVDPKTDCPYTTFLYPLKNAPEIIAGTASLDSLGVETPDDKTLVLTLTNPLSYFLNIIGQRTYYPQRKDLVEKYKDAYGKTHETIAFSGPYVLAEWNHAEGNSSLKYTKNKKYWNNKNVQIDTVNCIVGSAKYSDFLEKKLDMYSTSDRTKRAELIKDPSILYYASVLPRTSYLATNAGPSSLFRNTKIRRAVSVALDRAEYIDFVYGGTQVLASAFIPVSLNIGGQPFNSKKTGWLTKLQDDIEDPRALFIEGMQELGLGSDPSKVTLTISRGSTSASAHQSAKFLKQNLGLVLGCNVNIDLTTWAKFSKALKTGEFEAGILSWGADYDDPLTFLEIFWSKSSIYAIGWQDAEYDSLIEQAQYEADQDKRKELLTRAEEILVYEQAVAIPISYSTSHQFVHDYVEGTPVYYFNTMGFQRYKINEQKKQKEI